MSWHNRESIALDEKAEKAVIGTSNGLMCGGCDIPGARHGARSAPNTILTFPWLAGHPCEAKWLM